MALYPPPQVTGRESGATAEKNMSSAAKAVELFTIARRRLLDINNWKKYSGVLSAEFKLTDMDGNPLEGPPQVGNLIRIDLPGPGPRKGDGYDWVYIEEIQDQTDFTGMRVRPVAAPTSDENATSHFFTDAATSTFLVKREGTKVIASELGKNEVPNTETQHIIDKIRNTLVAVSASHGASFPQWKSLMEGFLEEEK